MAKYRFLVKGNDGNIIDCQEREEYYFFRPKSGGLTSMCLKLMRRYLDLGKSVIFEKIDKG